jgi:hypothetical protein
MEPVPPFWFKQRQCKAEKQDNLLKVTGPNLREAFLYARQGDNNLWAAGLRASPDAADTAATSAYLPSEEKAWDVAFELYRTNIIV